MSRALVVTALDVEARVLARHLGLTRRPGGDLLCYGGGLDLACVGPGARQLGRLPEGVRDVAFVVSAGICGALAPHLACGDLVVPEAVVTPDGRRHPVASLPGLSPSGTLLSVDRVVETAEAKARLHRESAALAVDMESAVIVAWARDLGIPAVVVRAVADRADRGVPARLARVVDAAGRTRVDRALHAVLTRPRMLADAVSLRRGTSVALRSVASAMRILLRERG